MHMITSLMPLLLKTISFSFFVYSYSFPAMTLFSEIGIVMFSIALWWGSLHSSSRLIWKQFLCVCIVSEVKVRSSTSSSSNIWSKNPQRLCTGTLMAIIITFSSTVVNERESLSKLSYNFGDERVIIWARMIENNETLSCDTNQRSESYTGSQFHDKLNAYEQYLEPQINICKKLNVYNYI